jgi:hypothetical protein
MVGWLDGWMDDGQVGRWTTISSIVLLEHSIKIKLDISKCPMFILYYTGYSDSFGHKLKT